MGDIRGSRVAVCKEVVECQRAARPRAFLRPIVLVSNGNKRRLSANLCPRHVPRLFPRCDRQLPYDLLVNNKHVRVAHTSGDNIDLAWHYTQTACPLEYVIAFQRASNAAALTPAT